MKNTPCRTEPGKAFDCQGHNVLYNVRQAAGAAADEWRGEKNTSCDIKEMVTALSLCNNKNNKCHIGKKKLDETVCSS